MHHIIYSTRIYYYHHHWRETKNIVESMFYNKSIAADTLLLSTIILSPHLLLPRPPCRHVPE
jgi:hypothetical protein